MDNQPPESISFFHYKTLLRKGETHATREKRHHLQGRREWGLYGSTSPDYEHTFEPLLGKFVSFHDFIKHKRTQKPPGKKVSALDLAAPTSSFLARQPLLDQGVAVTLTDNRNLVEKYLDHNRHLTTIATNLIRPSAWRKTIDPVMDRLGIADTGFDLITIRPFGAVSYDQRYLPIYFNLLNAAWTRLSPQNGDIFVQTYDGNYMTQNWLDQLRKQGFDINYHLGEEFAFRITKHPTSPIKLPPYQS